MVKNDIQMNIPDTFKALYAQPVGETILASVQEVPFSELPDHEVTIRVHYSSLNYKDALSSTGRNRVTRNYPHIPGIDASGVVVEDASGTFEPGESVIVTGQDLGTNTFGGFGEYIKVPADWVVSLPDTLSEHQAMIVGTAGFTAMYGVKRLQRELITPDSGDILVTGATGGVGSWAVKALSAQGYRVTAATRNLANSAFLKSLGATDVINSDDLLDVEDSPLLSRKWIGSIETVGGSLLDSVLRQTYNKGAVACCGNILGMKLHTNVLPFILRGISLLGIDSAFCEYDVRTSIWDTFAGINFDDLPNDFASTIELEQLPEYINSILSGSVNGRVVIEHRK
jgi:putative YhdH/YhfP family quinone oxidoreductase